MSVEPPDRATVVAAIMPDVLSIRLDVADDEVGFARLVSEDGGTLRGAVRREGAVRACRRPDAPARGGGRRRRPRRRLCAEVGGPLAAIRGAAPLALTWLQRLSAVASGASPPEPGDAIEAWAARLSAPGAVSHDGPSFRVEFEG